MFAELCEALLRDGRPVRFRAPGRSMAPAVGDGDVVTVAPVDVREVRCGDVLLYRTARGPIAHRVVAVPVRDAGDGHFRVRGDAPGSPDEVVPTEDVLGRVEAVAPRGGSRWRRLGGRALAALLRPASG